MPFAVVGSGTECGFVCANRRGPVPDEAALQAVAEFKQALPPVPKDTYLRVMRSRVIVEPEDTRGFGAARQRPEWLAYDRLDRLRQDFERFDYFEGIAFTHGGGE